MELIITFVYFVTWFAGAGLIRNTSKTVQIISTVLLLLFNIGTFIVFHQQSPEKFTDVFLTPQYAVMAAGVSFCQIGAVAIIRHFTPEEDLELTPLRVIILTLFANIVLAVFMAVLNGLMLVK